MALRCKWKKKNFLIQKWKHNKPKLWTTTKVEDIKMRWQAYTELYKKDLPDPENHDSVITHLEPDILECEAKWEASLPTKLVDVMEFQLSYSKS